eukprot:TRINITY_DN15301_c0_g1_i1.p1 TRINITY_DN15301_c0_g1~~TRINITY_DN15301_c0_g1_i1.p1  ORF type:complete len:940 (+),score=101.50 TRINITY_DN15301_c0_g1_i1:33-2852(+)
MKFLWLRFLLAVLVQSCNGALTKVGSILLDSSGIDSPKSVAIYKGYAYCADFKTGVKIVDVRNPSNPIMKTLLVFHDSSNSFTVWEEEDVGFCFDAKAGVIVFDLKNPIFPIEISRIALIGTSIAQSGVLDKDSKRLFVMGDEGGIHVIDVSNLSNLLNTAVSLTSPDKALQGAIHTSPVTGKKHLWVGTSEGIRTFDITGPTDFKFVENLVINTPVKHVFVANDLIYVCSTGQFEAWEPIPTKIELLNMYTPRNAAASAVFGSIAYVAGDLDKMYAVDVSDPKRITYITSDMSPYKPKDVVIDDYCYMVDGRSLIIYEVTDMTPAPPVPPTVVPTAVPTDVPTAVPTAVPTDSPTAIPTTIPDTVSPTTPPTSPPTAAPLPQPTAKPQSVSTAVPNSPIPSSMIPGSTVPPTAVQTAIPLNSAPNTSRPVVVPQIPPTDIPSTPIPTSKAESPVVDEEQIAQITGSAVAASAILSGGSVGAIRLAVIAGPCRLEDKQPFLFHPLQFAVGGSYATGAIVGNFSIIFGSSLLCAIVLKILTYLSLTNKSSYLSNLFKETDAQGVLRLPSAPLIIFQVLYQGTSLAGMQLISGVANGWRQVLGIVTVIVCFVVPLWILRKIHKAVPTKAIYYLSKSDQEYNRHCLVKSVIGRGEWISTSRDNLWANRYSSVIRPYRPECIYFSFIDYASSLALAGMQRIPVENDIQCGHVKLFSGILFTLLLITETVYWPHARSRDSLIDFVFLFLQAIALYSMAFGFYTPEAYDAASALSSKLLMFAGGLLMMKALVDLCTEIYIFKIRRRGIHQDEYWGVEEVKGDQFQMLDPDIAELESFSLFTLPEDRKLESDYSNMSGKSQTGLLALHGAIKSSLYQTHPTMKLPALARQPSDPATCFTRTTSSLSADILSNKKSSVPTPDLNAQPFSLSYKKEWLKTNSIQNMVI